MGNCCISNGAKTSIESIDDDSSDGDGPTWYDEFKINCWIMGNNHCGKSTFHKRIQMLSNVLENRQGLLAHLTSKDKLLCQANIFAATIGHLYKMISHAQAHGINNINYSPDENKYENKNNNDYNPTIPFKFPPDIDSTMKRFVDTFDTFEFYKKVDECRRAIRCSNAISKINNLLKLVDTKTINAFIIFFQSDEFKTILNNYQSEGRFESNYGIFSMMIDKILTEKHFKNIFRSNGKYILNAVDYLCWSSNDVHLQHAYDYNLDKIVEFTYSNINVYHEHYHEELYKYHFINVKYGMYGERYGRRYGKIGDYEHFSPMILKLPRPNVCVFMIDLSTIGQYGDNNHIQIQYILSMFVQMLLEIKLYPQVVVKKKHKKRPEEIWKKTRSIILPRIYDVIVLLNKYDVFFHNVNNDKNGGSVNCNEIINWVPVFVDFVILIHKLKKMVIL